MKLKWKERDVGSYTASISSDVAITLSPLGYNSWEFGLHPPGDWCGSMAYGKFRAKDLDAAKFEAVERALKWARKLVDKLESVK